MPPFPATTSSKVLAPLAYHTQAVFKPCSKDNEPKYRCLRGELTNAEYALEQHVRPDIFRVLIPDSLERSRVDDFHDLKRSQSTHMRSTAINFAFRAVLWPTCLIVRASAYDLIRVGWASIDLRPVMGLNKPERVSGLGDAYICCNWKLSIDSPLQV